MPRYFFNLVMGKVVYYDRKGRDFDDLSRAGHFAVQHARDVILNKLPKKALDRSECSVEVADESGTLLMTVPFSEVRT